MLEKYRVIYTLRAADQLEEIVRYIEGDSPDNAAKTAARLVKAIDSLDVFPNRFTLARDLGVLGEAIRSMPVRPYLIRYQVDEKTRAVTVLSIRHGARRPGL